MDKRGEYNGQPCIIRERRSLMRPIIERYYLPVKVVNPALRGYTGGLEYHIDAQGQILHSETIDVPCPKVPKGTETRWDNGHWQKWTKSKGWITIE
jgi:hypothetical protein